MADIKYIISVDAQGAVTQIKKVEGAVEGMKTQAKQAKAPLAGMMGKIAAGAISVVALKTALRGAVRFMGDCISKASEQEQVMAKLDAVLRSTGGAAGITKDEVIKLASGLQGVTTYGDETIISAQNLLLTFTKIGKDVFPDATEIVLDMSAALGQDLKSSAIQVGKALQDPILGATALRRVGVNLSQAQADLIKTMVEAGDTMGAQKLILTELKSEFGGTAREIRDTFAGSLEGLKNTFGDFQEQIGQAVTESEDFRDIIESINQIIRDAVDSGIITEWTGQLFGGLKQWPVMQPILTWLAAMSYETEGAAIRARRLKEEAETLAFAVEMLGTGFE